MPTTLSVSNVVNVTVDMSPSPASLRSFGTLLVAGASDVVDMGEAIRDYTTLAAVATDFGTSAPEYLAAACYFAQSPAPNLLKVARWAKAATPGVLKSATLTYAQQSMSNFVTPSGAFNINIDGTLRTLAGINLSGATTLSGVAAIVQTALTTWGTCTWNPVAGQFVIKSSTTGATSSVGVPTATLLSNNMGLSAVGNPTGVPVPGSIAESPLAAVARLAAAANDWYGLVFADPTITDAQHLSVGQFVEAASPSRIYGVSSSGSGMVDGSSTADLLSLLKSAGLQSTFGLYTTAADAFAPAASLLGRAFTVNYEGENTAITLKFKTLPGVAAEYMSATAAAAIKNKNGNIYVNYDNSTAIVQEGIMAGGNFIDETINLDWLQNAVQTDVYNFLYSNNTKVPQTDAGIHSILAVIENRLEGAVRNGVLAPGTWNAAQGFGQLLPGDPLPKGYYVYAPPIATQSQAARASRRAPVIQAAVKLAGAVHFADVIINVNR